MLRLIIAIFAANLIDPGLRIAFQKHDDNSLKTLTKLVFEKNKEELRKYLVNHPRIFEGFSIDNFVEICESAMHKPEHFQILLNHGFLSEKLATTRFNRSKLDRCLHGSVSSGSIAIASALMKLGASPNYEEPVVRTTPLYEAIESDNKEMVKILLEFGADVNKPLRLDEKEKIGNPPLLFVQSYEMALLLIKSGANVNFVNDRGENLIHAATGDKRCYLLRALIHTGIDVNLRSKVGLTAIAMARKYGNKNAIELLSAAGGKE